MKTMQADVVYLFNHFTDAISDTQSRKGLKPQGKALDPARADVCIGFVLTIEYTPSHVTIDFAGNVTAAADL